MAVHAFRRGKLVDDDLLVHNKPHLCVTLVASDPLVGPLQREMCPGVVIERRRNPSLRIVTIRTRSLFGLCELAGVRVFVAILTDLRSPLELHLC